MNADVKLLNLHVLELFVNYMTLLTASMGGDVDGTIPAEEPKDALSHVQRGAWILTVS